MNELLFSEEILRRRHHRHGELVLQWTWLQFVEGRLADQYGLPMLDGSNRAYHETSTISNVVHLVQNGNRRISLKRKNQVARS